MLRRRRPPKGAQPGTLVISEGSPLPRIRVMTYGPGELNEQDIRDVDQLRGVLQANKTSWIDVQGLGDENTLKRLADFFGIHPLSLEDVVNVPQRPKVEVFDNHLLLIARMAILESQATTSREQVSLLVGNNFVLTFQERYGDVFDPVRARIRQGGPIFRSSGAEYLAYALIDAVIDGYFPILEHFGEQLEQLEEAIIASPQQAAIQQIHHVKRELLAIRRAIWPLREVINSLLREGTTFITDKVQVHLRDCYDHCVQLIDVVETYRELGGGLMDVYLSSVANRQNDVMKTLTVIASIFIPLTFIAGLYGMNFEYMPELHVRWAYPVVLAIMMFAAFMMVVFFHRKGWIGTFSPKDVSKPFQD